MYQLFLDVGNTSIAVGLYQADTLQETGRIPTDKTKNPYDYDQLIDAFLTPFGVNIKALADCVIASVVPDLTQTLCAMWQKHHQNPPFIIHAGLKSNIKNKLDNPTELGSDLFAGAVAAHAAYPHTNAIVVDMGTATTVMVVTKNGTFRGGAIVTGLELMLRALIDNTALLSFTEAIEQTDVKAIGSSTQTAIASGMSYGYPGLVDNIITHIIRELATDDYHVITTGGQAPIIAKHSQYLKTYDPNLIFKGMRIIYEQNKQ